MLHYLDDLDSKMEAMRAQFERGGESEGAWTGYNPSLGRPLLNTAKFLAGKTPEEEEQDRSDGAPAAMPSDFTQIWRPEPEEPKENGAPP